MFERLVVAVGCPFLSKKRIIRLSFIIFLKQFRYILHQNLVSHKPLCICNQVCLQFIGRRKFLMRKFSTQIRLYFSMFCFAYSLLAGAVAELSSRLQHSNASSNVTLFICSCISFSAARVSAVFSLFGILM